jgi:hypothetical protein
MITPTWDTQGKHLLRIHIIVARTYIGFDIIKRIMRDFFGYNIKVRLSCSSNISFLALHEHH